MADQRPPVPDASDDRYVTVLTTGQELCMPDCAPDGGPLIHILGANPKDAQLLSVGSEVKAVQSLYEDAVKYSPAVLVSEAPERIGRYKGVAVVHISAHCDAGRERDSEDGKISFSDGAITGAELKNIICGTRSTAVCLVLMCCKGESIARLLLADETVPLCYVLCADVAIIDELCIDFSRAFYKYLYLKYDFRRAFLQARAHLGHEIRNKPLIVDENGPKATVGDLREIHEEHKDTMLRNLDGFRLFCRLRPGAPPSRSTPAGYDENATFVVRHDRRGCSLSKADVEAVCAKGRVEGTGDRANRPIPYESPESLVWQDPLWLEPERRDPARMCYMRLRTNAQNAPIHLPSGPTVTGVVTWTEFLAGHEPDASPPRDPTPVATATRDTVSVRITFKNRDSVPVQFHAVLHRVAPFSGIVGASGRVALLRGPVDELHLIGLLCTSGWLARELGEDDAGPVLETLGQLGPRQYAVFYPERAYPEQELDRKDHTSDERPRAPTTERPTTERPGREPAAETPPPGPAADFPAPEPSSVPAAPRPVAHGQAEDPAPEAAAHAPTPAPAPAPTPSPAPAPAGPMPENPEERPRAREGPPAVPSDGPRPAEPPSRMRVSTFDLEEQARELEARRQEQHERIHSRRSARQLRTSVRLEWSDIEARATILK